MQPFEASRSGDDPFDADVLVVGGGIAGLVAAACAARAGARTMLVERASEVGGRAATHEAAGFHFNVGPHALYDGGPAATILAELGVSYTGRRPSASGGLAFHRGSLHALPGGFVSLLTTDLLSLGGKLELGKALGSLGKLDAARLAGTTTRQWLDAAFHDPVVRGLVESLLRVTSYANDPDRSCAAASVAQLQAGIGKGVLYLDGGWQTLVAGLRKAAEDVGARIVTGLRVRSVRVEAGHVQVFTGPSRMRSVAQDPTAEHGEVEEISLGSPSGAPRVLRARVAIVALPPAAAAAVVEGEGARTVKGWVADAKPVKAACLDLGLRRLPEPRRSFVVGIDAPLYFSVHSATARLAPEGAAVVHVARYLGPRPVDAKAVEAELEAFCDVVQPGWRGEVVERRFLPQMLVAGALVEAGKPRPGPEVPGAPSLLLAGDWIGGVSMIADTAIASGREAGRLAAARAARPLPARARPSLEAAAVA